MGVPRRIIKIDLSEYSEDWSDSYIKFISANTNQVRSFTKEIERINKKLEKVDSKEEKTDKDIKESERLSAEIFQTMQDLIVGNFVEAKIKDGDTFVILTKEELPEMLDMVLIQAFSGAIMGNVEKKD